MGRYAIPELIAGLKARDWRVLGRAITMVENNADGKEALMDYACANAREDGLILGITGAGGAGKSTLIDKLVQIYLKEEKRVGILSVDPSSPFTGGALLGDRIRMGGCTPSAEVYMRSFASRGAYGGISQGAKDALYLYKAFGFDVIIIESLGVGQAETDISAFADVTAVVLAPGNGDGIQLAKAGTQEIADLYVINKGDKPEAGALRLQILSALEAVPEDRRPAVVTASATGNQGIDTLVEGIDSAAKKFGHLRKMKRRARIENEIYTSVLRHLEEPIKKRTRVLLTDVLEGKCTPHGAAALLAAKIKIED
ncbi:MAG: methylmalonyl Co-A mutase-associated GTPase MeaB [Christensenella sp.]|uniref:methylmalonyl Co-A mutase-associated GTPase MeaB n=1 Tax=Christensenella sp. TaxID=1935934 RepID=UPI002B1FBCCB|nr:methylmalonyl Co-A mutase-associated GTPase MeaB [Christensenella sp.]MEA5002515.1 methylmalonyl Co-A mutase-associated GTPase MeaB [Christensenella sp.]